MRIKFQTSTTIGGSRWSVDGSAETEAGAIAQAQDLAQQFVGVRWFMELLVWDMETPQGRLIGSVSLGEVATKVTLL